MDKTMTKREFLTAVSALNGTDMLSNETIDEVVAYATVALAKLNAQKGHKTEKQKAEIAAKDKEATELAQDFLTDKPQTATDVMEAFNKANGTEVKVQAMSAKLRRAVDLGVANVEDVKIPKKGTQKGYTLAEFDPELDVEVDAQ